MAKRRQHRFGLTRHASKKSMSELSSHHSVTVSDTIQAPHDEESSSLPRVAPPQARQDSQTVKRAE